MSCESLLISLLIDFYTRIITAEMSKAYMIALDTQGLIRFEFFLTAINKLSFETKHQSRRRLTAVIIRFNTRKPTLLQ